MSAYEEPELELSSSPNKVKLIRNTKGVNWEISVVEGFDQDELDRIREAAVGQHRALEMVFGETVA